VAGAADLIDRRAYGRGALGQVAGHVCGYDVLRRALVHVDAEDLVEHLVLAEIDVPFGHRREQGAEDPMRGGVVLAQKGGVAAS
jgi:hypothetical protein